MSQNQWSVLTLKEYFDAKIADRDVRVDIALTSAKDALARAKEYIEATNKDRDIRVDLALSAAKEAVGKAEAADEKRFGLLNEFRGQQADLSAGYATRDSLEQSRQSNDRRVTALETTVALLQGRALAFTGVGALFGGTIGAVIVKFFN